MIIGVLALQGDFAEHVQLLHSMNVATQEVRTQHDCTVIDGLIIPGGESTVMSCLLSSSGLRESIQQSSLPILGTCAGAVLLAKNVIDGKGVEPLRLVDIDIQRNAYGRQAQSRRSAVRIGSDTVPVAFIRAPKICNVGSTVTVLAEDDGEPILVQEGNRLAATFHTETTGSTALHTLFLDLFHF